MGLIILKVIYDNLEDNFFLRDSDVLLIIIFLDKIVWVYLVFKFYILEERGFKRSYYLLIKF